jgi:hypothetical protein
MENGCRTSSGYRTSQALASSNSTSQTPPNPETYFNPAQHEPTTVHKTTEHGDPETEDGNDAVAGWSWTSRSEIEEVNLLSAGSELAGYWCQNLISVLTI